MGFLHDEDDLRPLRQLGGHRGVGVRREAGGGDLQAGVAAEHLFGGGAAQAVSTAKEEDAFQGEFLRTVSDRTRMGLIGGQVSLALASRAGEAGLGKTPGSPRRVRPRRGGLGAGAPVLASLAKPPF